MATVGGEIGQLQALRATFEREALAVQELANRLRSELEQTWWTGAAADRFRATWGSDFEPTLRRLHAALAEAGTEVHRRTEALLEAGS
jgi:WXG100 family type VII secretion target